MYVLMGMVVFMVVLLILELYSYMHPFCHPVRASEGTYMYVYQHQADFVADERVDGRYWVGKYIEKTDQFWCWGIDRKDAQCRITKEYDEKYPNHSSPIVIKRVLEWGRRCY